MDEDQRARVRGVWMEARGFDVRRLQRLSAQESSHGIEKGASILLL